MKKQWFEVSAIVENHENVPMINWLNDNGKQVSHMVLAKVKSKGLAYLVKQEFEKIFSGKMYKIIVN
jgi:hypothetical protein